MKAIDRTRRRAVCAVGMALLTGVLTGSAAAAEQPPAMSPPTIVLEPGAVAGAAPARGYVIGNVLHAPDGQDVTLPHSYGPVGAVGTHLIGLRDFGQTGAATLDVLDADGEIVLTQRAQSFAVSDDHTVAAWIGPRGRVFTWTEADGVGQLRRLRAGTFVTDVNGSVTCKESEGGNCAVYFDGPGRPGFTTSHGIIDIVAPDAIGNPKATDDGKLAYFTSFRDLGSCSRVKPGFRTCRHSFGDFSDSGRRILGFDDFRDGIGDRFVDMLNARTGRIQVRATTPNSGFIGEVVWEDNDSILVNAWVRGDAQLYRVNADGTSERVAEAVASEDVDNPYRLVR